MIGLYFDTDFTAKWVHAFVDEKGVVKIGERDFVVKNQKPSLLIELSRGIPLLRKPTEKVYPFYIFKHDRNEPINICDLESTETDPSVIGKMIDLSAFETFMQYKPKTDRKLIIFFSAISFIIGIVLSLVLVLTKIVRL